ncbi:MAG: hypothetical protein ACR2F1_04305 [Nitrososphaeraceae archaeon]
METQAHCEECCNKTFPLANLNLNLNEVSNLTFYQGPQCTIIAVYEKNKKIYMVISYDCGKTFGEHIQIMEMEGNIKKLEILADHSQFVIALLENIGGLDGRVRKRAVSGTFATTDKSTQFSYKQCENYEQEPDEEIYDMSCGFRPMKNGKAGQIESVDYVFTRIGNKIRIQCFGHGCIIKE